ncbi:MAG: ThuA domain-containing protein [Planctomycetota bacterium]|nr:ThuA domain-containing protein [Planctomycetota bacterium]MDA1161632.1 ThuA domain-containing protein [Planctomycetota bacterium]
MARMSWWLVVVAAFFAAPAVSEAEETGDSSIQLRLHFEGASGPGSGKHIVFVTGEEYYRSEEGMPMFAKILSQRHGFDCTVLFAIDPESGVINPNKIQNIPGLETLASAELLVLFTRFRELPDHDTKHIADFINAGKPVIGFRNATHPFRYSADTSSAYASWDFRSKKWPGGFGQQILGDTWVSHHGKFQKEATLAKVNAQHASHPVLRGVSPELFARTDVNGVNKLTADDTVLYHGHVLPALNREDSPVTDGRNDRPMPWAWFHNYTAPSGKTGRSFCLTAGASVDWLEEDLRRLVVNSVYSLTGLEDKIPPRNNVDFVDAYEPSAAGSHTDAEWSTLNLRQSSFGLTTSGRKGPTAVGSGAAFK